MSKNTITSESCVDCCVSVRIIGSQDLFGESDVLPMDSDCTSMY